MYRVGNRLFPNSPLGQRAAAKAAKKQGVEIYRVKPQAVKVPTPAQGDKYIAALRSGKIDPIGDNN
jgi:hypothetical protein